MATNGVGAVSGGAHKIQIPQQATQAIKPRRSNVAAVVPAHENKPARAAKLEPNVGNKLDVRV
jgi:metal-dependent hydrolase (beta-lactamase superfamily II)